MDRIREWLTAFLRHVAGWGASSEREGVVDAISTGPCPRCGEERLRVRDVRVDDLGYSVRVRERWSCGCDGGPEEPAPRPDPAGIV